MGFFFFLCSSVYVSVAGAVFGDLSVLDTEAVYIFDGLVIM